jgi:O-Antigen ligase
MENKQIITDHVAARIGHTQGRLFVYSFLACIFAFPLSSYISEFLGIQSNFLSIIARACTLALVIWYFGFLLLNNLFRPVPAFYLFVLFWLLYIIRIFHDTLQYGWMLGRPPTDYYLFALVLSFFCSFPFFVPVAVPYKFMEKVTWGILILLNLLGAWNILTADVLFLERLGGNERLNPILFGMLAAMLAALSLVRLLRPGNPVLFRILNISAILLGFFNLVASASKSPVLFVLATIGGLLVYHSKKGNKKSLFLLIFILVAVVAAVFLSGMQEMLLLVFTRFTEITDDDSSLERWDMLSGGFIQFLQEPLLGSFLEEKIHKEYPHNLVVEAFMATGLVGGTIFILYYLSAIRATINILFQTGFSLLSLTALSVIILSMFSGGLSFSVDFWVCTGATFALAYQNSGLFFQMSKTEVAGPGLQAENA